MYIHDYISYYQFSATLNEQQCVSDWTTDPDYCNAKLYHLMHHLSVLTFNKNLPLATPISKKALTYLKTDFFDRPISLIIWENLFSAFNWSVVLPNGSLNAWVCCSSITLKDSPRRLCGFILELRRSTIWLIWNERNSCFSRERLKVGRNIGFCFFYGSLLV